VERLPRLQVVGAEDAAVALRRLAGTKQRARRQRLMENLAECSVPRTEERARMNGRNHVVVALLSITLIALELAWTRIFSAEFFYTFAFLILSLAILGLGLGALARRVLPVLGREGALGTSLCLTVLFTLIGPPLVFRLSPDFTLLFHDAPTVARFLGVVLLLALPYFFGGIALATIFRRNPAGISRLYMADLLGAAAGVFLVMAAMNRFGTPLTCPWCAFPTILAALLVSRSWRWVFPLLLAVGMIALGQHAPALLEKERQERMPVVYKHWDAMAKVKIYQYMADEETEAPARGLEIDNLANSPVLQFDGNWDRPDSAKFEFGIDVSFLVDRFDSCTFLSLGAGGGGDVMQALQAGAAEIHAVEVVPHVNELMTTGFLAEYTGHIYDDPRVTVATEDARAYVRRHRNEFDVIYSLSSNTFAALASGAFAMAENYLFTREAFRDYWLALTDNGFLSMEHQFYMPRLVTELKEALTGLGVEQPESHFAVYDLPAMRRNLLLLSKQPLTDELRNLAYGELTPEKEEHIHLLHPAPAQYAGNLIDRIVREGWRSQADSATIDLSPATDNRPFVAQLGLWKNFSRGSLERVMPLEIRGFPLAKLLVGIILAVVVVLILPLNLLPFFSPVPALRPVPWLYFFTIGLAFMAVEVVLIQKWALFIGPSIHSITTILFALLVGSGLGSLAAPRMKDGLPFVAIVAWIALDVFLFEVFVQTFGHLTLTPRVLLTGLIVAPLGFFMGMPFPKAGRRVGEGIDWGFAVNGAASTLGATGIVLVSFLWGFRVSMGVGAAL
jgi:MFS family permease